MQRQKEEEVYVYSSSSSFSAGPAVEQGQSNSGFAVDRKAFWMGLECTSPKTLELP